MILSKIIAILLIIGGILGLVYRRLHCADGSCKTNLGPVDVQIKEEDINRVKAPFSFWACLVVIAIGGVLLFVRT
jgi:hypothetical protein